METSGKTLFTQYIFLILFLKNLYVGLLHGHIYGRTF